MLFCISQEVTCTGKSALNNTTTKPQTCGPVRQSQTWYWLLSACQADAMIPTIQIWTLIWPLNNHKIIWILGCTKRNAEIMGEDFFFFLLLLGNLLAFFPAEVEARSSRTIISFGTTLDPEFLRIEGKGEDLRAVHMVKKGHKYVTLLQINVPRVMILSQKLGTFIWQGDIFLKVRDIYLRSRVIYLTRRNIYLTGRDIYFEKGHNFVTNY